MGVAKEKWLKPGLRANTPPEVDGLGPDDDEKEEIFLDE
jgi:hypothetical protein